MFMDGGDRYGLSACNFHQLVPIPIVAPASQFRLGLRMEEPYKVETVLQDPHSKKQDPNATVFRTVIDARLDTLLQVDATTSRLHVTNHADPSPLFARQLRTFGPLVLRAVMLVFLLHGKLGRSARLHLLALLLQGNSGSRIGDLLKTYASGYE
ncbi:hypothetical protein L198_04533 [Cryptococcus wingfieldii CBS 7118]|uniref:Uncharacterized protein n=1 Tax=Cryptococcus wingfieldii CBS 7118 TaxID=1295528 RepID=A0A1E3J4Y6_9TREE|nr:hypothetical protein L198_04533 [Cryptococcus wingfieldii CBS 7118]ODN95914.1 hypothetical protein L198_04533 [Cryptococcus wingfieldii CBS 7118]